MLTQVVVSYGEHFALYELYAEKDGVYNAELVRFYGSPEAAPPKEILLVKGVRKWIGYPGLPELLNELGKAIEYNRTNKIKIPLRLTGEPTNPDKK